MAGVEEDYLDVLKNIEAAIVSVFREHPELADYQVDSAIEALGRTYIGESRHKPPVLPKSPLAKEVYERVKGTCDWLMGRENVVDETGQPVSTDESLTVDKILACLKRIRKSISLWTKEAGSQGYLKYVRQFME